MHVQGALHLAAAVEPPLLVEASKTLTNQTSSTTADHPASPFQEEVTTNPAWYLLMPCPKTHFRSPLWSIELTADVAASLYVEVLRLRVLAGLRAAGSSSVHSVHFGHLKGNGSLDREAVDAQASAWEEQLVDVDTVEGGVAQHAGWKPGCGCIVEEGSWDGPKLKASRALDA
jgi:hypothetical protein